MPVDEKQAEPLRSASLDHAGRIVIPKVMRDALRMRAGEPLTIEERDDAIIIRRLESTVHLRQIDGWWVISGGGAADFSVPALIEVTRTDRIKELGGE